MNELTYATDILPQLLEGLRLTVIITIIASAIALVLGFFLGFVRNRQIPVLGRAAEIYIQVIRNTPLLVQLYLFFFALPQFGVTISPTTSSIIVLGMNSASYMAEIYRAGIESIHPEQWDACKALNLPTRKVWTRIIIPQAIPPILPALGNSINEMLKLTSYAATIGVIELFGQGLRAAELTYRYMVPFTMVGIIYLVVSITLTILIRRLELRNASRKASWAAV